MKYTAILPIGIRILCEAPDCVLRINQSDLPARNNEGQCQSTATDPVNHDVIVKWAGVTVRRSRFFNPHIKVKGSWLILKKGTGQITQVEDILEAVL